MAAGRRGRAQARLFTARVIIAVPVCPPETRDRMAGEVDYLMKIVVPDIAAYDRVYQRLIRSVDLSDVSSSFAMEELKNTTALPLD